jgi:hypothetical protein
LARPPNDRVTAPAPAADVPAPKVYFVVGERSFGRPSLETYYARTPDRKNRSTCSCDTVAGTYCSCNKVCTCNLVCSCESVCSCVGYRSRSGGGGTYCSCNKVCTCVPVH